MSRDRRSQRIREQFRAHANPRSGQTGLAQLPLREQLKRVYGGDSASSPPQEAITAEVARRMRRRR